MEGGRRCLRAGGCGRGEAASAWRRRVRRPRRRLPGTARSPGRPMGRPRPAGRLHPAGLALGHVGLGSRPLRAGERCVPRTRPHRPSRVSRRGPRHRGHAAACDVLRPDLRAAEQPFRGLPGRRRGTGLPSAVATHRRLPVRRQADPAPRARDHPRRGQARPRPRNHDRRARPARPAFGDSARQRRLDRLDRLRAARRRVPQSALRPRNLRHVAEGRPRHPEQGVPGDRVRSARDHRRHACGPRAARRRRERIPRSARRPRCARGRAAASGTRRGTARTNRGGRPPYLPRARRWQTLLEGLT